MSQGAWNIPWYLITMLFKNVQAKIYKYEIVSLPQERVYTQYEVTMIP